MGFLRKCMPCSCMKQQNIDENGNLREDLTISIKTSCCRKTKIINININKDNIETIGDIKDIMDKIENKVKK